MKAYIVTTAQGVEICVECDDFREDLPGDILTAKCDGKTVRVFNRASVMCWEELQVSIDSVSLSGNSAGSVSRKPARDHGMSASP